jgi:hypothetical protein
MPSGRQLGVELVQPFLQRDEIGAPLGHELDAKPVSPEHLEDEAAEIADALFALAHERPLLAFERRRMGGASRRLASGGARASASAEGPQTCHQQSNLADGSYGGFINAGAIDRSVQTDGQAKPARPEDGAVSGASWTAWSGAATQVQQRQHEQHQADRPDDEPGEAEEEHEQEADDDERDSGG